MLRWVRLVACVLAIVAGAGAGSCVLNPQPEPPRDEAVSPRTGAGGSAGPTSAPGPAAGGSYDSQQDASAAHRGDSGTSRTPDGGVPEGGDSNVAPDGESDAGSATDAPDEPDGKTTTGI
jgi:hypothetical protein